MTCLCCLRTQQTWNSSNFVLGTWNLGLFLLSSWWTDSPFSGVLQTVSTQYHVPEHRRLCRWKPESARNLEISTKWSILRIAGINNSKLAAYAGVLCVKVSATASGLAQSVSRLTTGWRVRGLSPGGSEIFRNRPNWQWKSTQPPVQWVTGTYWG